MQDYVLLTDTVKHNFIIEREDDTNQFRLDYVQRPDSTISLHGVIDTDNLNIILKRIDLKQLPALQNEFNWTTDP